MIPAITDWSQAMLTSFAGGLAMFVAAIPKVIAFAVILVVGWFVAGLIARLLVGLLHAARFNSLADRSGLTRFVNNAGMKSDASTLLGLIAKWFVRLIALI